MTSVLPRWRRSPLARYGSLAALLLPALAAQALLVDAQLLPRLLLLLLVGGTLAILIEGLRVRSAAGVGYGAALADGFVQTALLAVLWPSTVAPWFAACALALALVLRHALGGWAVNPFPPAMLALGLAWPLLLVLDRPIGMATPAPTASVIAWVGGLWVLASAGGVALRLLRWRTALGFAVPTMLTCVTLGMPAAHLLALLPTAGIVLGEPRHWPSTTRGQWAVGMAAGLGTGLLWLQGAAPTALAFPVLLAGALTPWLQRITRSTPVQEQTPAP